MKYSIIVPVYNCKSYLQECVDSVLAQTISDFELLLIDDGSTDGSGALADALGTTDDRIRVFHKPNGGAASARNLGIDNSCGEYIIFVDGDDVIEPTYLCLCDKLMDECLPDLFVFGMAFDYYNGNILAYSRSYCYPHWATLTKNTWTKAFVELFNYNCWSSACSKVFSSRIIKRNEIRYNEELVFYEDFDFVLRYLNHTNTITCYPEDIYHYRHILNTRRFYDHIADLNRVNIVLCNLHKSLSRINVDNCLIIETSIAGFVVGSLLQQSFVSFKKTKNTVKRINSTPEFARIYSENELSGGRVSKVLSLVFRRKYTALWLYLCYKAARNSVVTFVKRVGEI